MATNDQNSTAGQKAAAAASKTVDTAAKAKNEATDAVNTNTDSTNGTTTIADGVVAKIAGIAAREVSGVYALGGGGARAIGAIRSVVNAEDLTQGIKVEVGERQAAADVTIVVEYPAPVHEVASNVRQAITNAISDLVGLEVVEVNVVVDDVHLPSEDKDDKSGDDQPAAPQATQEERRVS